MHFCQKQASCLLTYRGVTRGERGAQFPGRRITMGAHCGGRRMTAMGAEKSQQCNETVVLLRNNSVVHTIR